MSSTSVFLERLLSLWSESREEIRQRIRQRDLYVIQMMVAVAGVLVASRLSENETDLAWLWLTIPLPLFYYSIMTYHSYLIHKQLARYMSDSLEPKIMDAISKESETYLEYEQFFKTENSVGVRKWLFMSIPIGVSLIVMSYSIYTNFSEKSRWFLIWPTTFVLVCYACNWFLDKNDRKWKKWLLDRTNNCVRKAFAAGAPIVAIICVGIWKSEHALELDHLFSSFKDVYYLLFPFIFWRWYVSMNDVAEKMETNHSKKFTRVSFIGFGEVVKTKYLPLLSDLDGFGEYEVLDLDAERVSGESHIEACNRIVRTTKDRPDVWVVATPSSTHYDYYNLMKQMNCICAIEKPATIDLSHYKSMRSESFGENTSSDWFPMGYYLLEKGFPLLYLLNDEISELEDYSELVDVKDIAPAWHSKSGCDFKKLRDALGQVKELRGLILEGGSSNELRQRFWVLDNGGGGNTWETLFHLVNMVSIAKSFNSRFDDEQLQLHIKSRIFHKFDLGVKKVIGDIGSYVSFGENGEWKIGTSKMIDKRLNRRSLEILTENNFIISMDFEKCELKVVKKEDSERSIQIRIKNKLTRKYELQMVLLKRWLNSKERESKEHKMYLPMKIYDDAMVLMERIILDGGKPVEPIDKPELNGADKEELIEAGWNKKIFLSLEES